MVLIDEILVSDEIFSEQFVCDLSKCKGACCVEGDCGAPLTEAEAEQLSQAYPKVKGLLLPKAVQTIAKNGFYDVDKVHGKVTPTLNGGICAYGYYDKNGMVKCALETRFREGTSDIPKPVSCALFPIRVIEKEGYIALNYEPQPGICKPACKLGKSLKMPVYRFLKEPLIRRFGKEFYEAMEAVAKTYFTK